MQGICSSPTAPAPFEIKPPENQPLPQGELSIAVAKAAAAAAVAQAAATAAATAIMSKSQIFRCRGLHGAKHTSGFGVQSLLA